MKKFTKSVILVIMLLLAMLLSGCCLNHSWEEATCTQPKTCSKCGETEGEPLGHSWKEATYWEPEVCTVCNATQGQPLENYFDANHIIYKTGLSDTKTMAIEYNEESGNYVTGVAKVTFTNYRVEKSSKPGYVKISFELNQEMHVEVPRSWGGAYSVVSVGMFCDLYSGECAAGGDLVDDEASRSELEVSYKGKNYTIYMSIEQGETEWQYNPGNPPTLDDYIPHTITIEMPREYDGLIYVLGSETEYREPSFGSSSGYFEADKDSQCFRIIP